MPKLDKKVELSIRRGYSKDIQRFGALQRWVGNALAEMCIHDERIYSSKVRLKSIESLLEKIASDPEKRKAVKSYRSAVAKIDDFIGARVIAYLSSSMEDLHHQLTEFPRFRINQVTIHDQQHNPVYKNLTEELRKQNSKKTGIFSTGGKLEIKLNDNGYTGFHYVVAACPVDPFYKNEPGVFPKFELQLRTLIQEAWSEVNHGVIYKGRSKELIKRQKSASLKTLAGILLACDSALSDAAK